MRTQRHETWERLDELIDRIGLRYGRSVKDSRCGKIWDLGQAVCAEAYGPGWNNDLRFLEDDRRVASEPAPDGLLEAAQRLVNGECPWASAG